jgi:hypothetical protein
MTKTRRVDELVWREDLYPRLTPDAQKIQTYAENTDVLPPVEVNQNNILIDGYHRWRAFQTAKLAEIPVIVTHTDSEEQLLMLAVERNAKHGLQLSNEEKSKYAVRWWDIRPQDEICRVLSISAATFNRWTRNKREQREEEIKKEIIARWMRCETHEAIAEAVGIPRRTVSDKIADFGETNQMSDSAIFRDFEPQIYTVWNFGKSTNEVKHFGNIPPEILDNLLYYYTKPLDVVFDPFGGGGMSIDVCKKRQRRYYVSDLTPIPARITEIRQHDITTGLPDDLPVPDLVFLDPPYWKQAAGRYSDKDTDLGNVELDAFLDTIGNIARDVKRKWGTGRPDARLAIIVGPWKQDGTYIDLPFLCYERIAKYLTLDVRVQVPYSTQVHGGAFVKMAQEKKQLLYLTRDLMVFGRDDDTDA